MVQRIQSVLMALGAILMFTVIFLPIWIKKSTQSAEQVVVSSLSIVHSNGSEIVSTNQTSSIIAGLCIGSVLLFIYSIFSYKTRTKQMKLNMLNTLVMGLTLGAMIFCVESYAKPLFDLENNGNFGYGFFLPVIAMIANAIANRFIKKDDDLVRSADRFR